MSVFCKVWTRRQTWLGAAHAAPPDVRSGHPGLRSLDTGWRFVILAPLASDAGEPARAAPRGIQFKKAKGATTHVQSTTPNLSLSLRERAGVRVPSAARQPRAAFTLVELLAVIVIIAMLAALVTPAVFNARRSAQNAAIKAEIDMLHMAIMNYKNEFGSFPPSNSSPIPSDRSARHIRRIFPRTSSSYAPSASTTPENALFGWLSGYSSDPTDPLAGQRKKLFDFDSSRVVGTAYHPARMPGSPYIYIDASEYLTGGIPPAVRIFSLTGGNYFAQRRPTSGGDFADVGQDAFNPDTFQIICAGLDETFGTDDDLSNFWPGTRQDYLDSLE